ncbi:hypothetical protein SAY87_022424 [Trapa incisa]|uniref:Uncharacterized protein n=1 Tax=Trapa incisa TaxID=236973 RepID=A0AAN7K7S2_9MYRT|nr:hypothetical protein SAY87_022424 [Trapa incisa]
MSVELTKSVNQKLCMPLILQMVHDPYALEPRCRFPDEDSVEYRSPVVSGSVVAGIIRSRTKSLLKLSPVGEMEEGRPPLFHIQFRTRTQSQLWRKNLSAKKPRLLVPRRDELLQCSHSHYSSSPIEVAPMLSWRLFVVTE